MDILLIDPKQKQIKKLASENNWTIDECDTGLQALNKLKHFNYDIVITEIYIPIIDGISLCALIKERHPDIKVIITTVEKHYYKKIQAFHAKADEYIVKPIAGGALMSIIEKHGKISRSCVRNMTKRIQVSDMILNPETQEVFRFGERIRVNKKELNLLMFMMMNEGVALNRNTIIENIWNEKIICGCANIIDVYINKLRKKIDLPFKRKLIHTVHGVGYKLCEM